MFNLSLMLNNLNDWFSNPLAIVGMVVLALGLALTICAKNITKCVRKSNSINSHDKLFVILAIIGVVLILLGFVLIIINCLK